MLTYLILVWHKAKIYVLFILCPVLLINTSPTMLQLLSSTPALILLVVLFQATPTVTANISTYTATLATTTNPTTATATASTLNRATLQCSVYSGSAGRSGICRLHFGSVW